VNVRPANPGLVCDEGVAMSGWIIGQSDPILVTGANGFIGARVVRKLLEDGFDNVRGFVRPSGNRAALDRLACEHGPDRLRIVVGNLQSRESCEQAVEDVSLVYHLAAGRGEKSFPDAYSNSVITTRNLLDAALSQARLARFVNVSSFTVYSNEDMPAGALLDETCALEASPHLTGEAYCYAKVRQEELVRDYAEKRGIAYVNLRPGVVYGPGNAGIPGRVGIASFGLFLHLGGRNLIPLCYVDNCADAIVLAGLAPGVDGETFNIVDDDLPTSREFLALYKRNVGAFKSVYLPHLVSRFLCVGWESYSVWSEGQLPPVFNRKKWARYWKGNRYSNAKLKHMLGWNPKIGFREGWSRTFAHLSPAGGMV
jgi:nucleoside-diphosphate-sugar epimerase